MPIFLRETTAPRLLLILLLAATAAAQSTLPAANPARPTVTNPATLPPTGYLQFEQGYLGAIDAPETQSQHSVVQTTKLAFTDRAMVQLQTQPFARSIVDNTITHDAGDVLLGGEFVLFTPKESEDDAVKEAKDRHRHSYVQAAVPTVTLSYLGRVKSGTAPDLDTGSFSQSLAIFASGHAPFVDVHYDINILVNEQTADSGAHRAQFGETFSVDRALGPNPNLQFAAEVYHFSQPLVHATSDGHPIARADLLAALFALSYEVRPNLVLDAGFSRGLTSTTTRWQAFTGFTYVLPHRLWKQKNREK
jgi:hypothetical protein